MRPADGWSPGALRRAWWAVAGVVAPQRVMLSKHFARYDEDATYRAEWNTLMQREYSSARSTDTSTPFKSGWGPRSADAELLHDLPWLRNRCRELARDDAVAVGVLRAWVEGVAGTGIGDRATLENDEQGNRGQGVDKAWRMLRKRLFPAERVSWERAQRMLARSKLIDGEVWVTRYWPEDGGPVQFEIVEADRVQTPLDAEPVDPKGWIRDGVERDGSGRLVAYWVSKRHPGDTAIAAVMKGDLNTVRPMVKEFYTRVLVDDAVHLKQGVPRPGQSRGEPILHAVIQDLRDLDLLVLAVLKRVQVAASFAAFIQTKEDIQTVASATAKKYGFRLDQDIVPGMIFKLFPGEEISTLNPNFPMPDLDVFVRLLARRIGTALGVSWQIVLSDYSEANFSSAKADDRRAEQSYSCARQDLVECLTWIRETVLQDALMRGELDASADDVAGVTWIAPSRQVLLDPEKENNADIAAVQAGLLSLRRVLSARSIDWREELTQIALEKDLREELGLPPLVPEEPAPGEEGQQQDKNDPTRSWYAEAA